MNTRAILLRKHQNNQSQSKNCIYVSFLTYYVIKTELQNINKNVMKMLKHIYIYIKEKQFIH